jgi:hypothetical protein
MRKLLLISLLTIPTLLPAKIYFVAPDGRDSNKGTIASPFATLGKAYAQSDADTIYLRGGVYKVSEKEIAEKNKTYARVFKLSRQATAESPIFIGGYADERPVFDFSAVRPEGLRVCAFYVSGSHHHLRGFDVVGVQVTIKGHTQSECFRNERGCYNVYENLAMHDGMAIGFYLIGGSNNLVLNCDAYNNYDDYSEGIYGGNTDGFGGHPLSAGDTGNVFRGCRAWWNSDDGFDLINANAAITIDNCWSFLNGYQPRSMENAGDGTGFKSGGYGMKPAEQTKSPVEIPQHVVKNCIAYYNRNKGFYANHHLGGIVWVNNSAMLNPSNYCMLNRKSKEEVENVPGYGHTIINNVSLQPRSEGKHIVDVDETACHIYNNSFNLPVETTAEDFESLDAEQLKAPRQADGSLPEISFLKAKRGTTIQRYGMGY